MLTGGWEKIKLTAYAVNLKNAAAGRENGLLSPLVQKSLSGATMDVTAVLAVIEYEFGHWARFYLLNEFGL